jgi:hypothetical protein
VIEAASLERLLLLLLLLLLKVPEIVLKERRLYCFGFLFLLRRLSVGGVIGQF